MGIVSPALRPKRWSTAILLLGPKGRQLWGLPLAVLHFSVVFDDMAKYRVERRDMQSGKLRIFPRCQNRAGSGDKAGRTDSGGDWVCRLAGYAGLLGLRVIVLARCRWGPGYSKKERRLDSRVPNTDNMM